MRKNNINNNVIEGMKNSIIRELVNYGESEAELNSMKLSDLKNLLAIKHLTRT